MCICNNCERIFEEDEIRWIEESRGEHFGYPAYERWATCPYCHSDDIEDYEEPDEDEEDDE